MLLLQGFVLFGRKSEDAMEFFGETLGFIQGEELEGGAFIVFQLLLHESRIRKVLFRQFG